MAEMAIAGTVDAHPTDVIVEHSPSKDLLCALFAPFQWNSRQMLRAS
ncbi:hypothetical protein [Brucella intermedia]|nr:hypothetical protein [Brucella intermedia]